MNNTRTQHFSSLRFAGLWIALSIIPLLYIALRIALGDRYILGDFSIYPFFLFPLAYAEKRLLENYLKRPIRHWILSYVFNFVVLLRVMVQWILLRRDFKRAWLWFVVGIVSIILSRVPIFVFGNATLDEAILQMTVGYPYFSFYDGIYGEVSWTILIYFLLTRVLQVLAILSINSSQSLRGTGFSSQVDNFLDRFIYSIFVPIPVYIANFFMSLGVILVIGFGLYFSNQPSGMEAIVLDIFTYASWIPMFIIPMIIAFNHTKKRGIWALIQTWLWGLLAQVLYFAIGIVTLLIVRL